MEFLYYLLGLMAFIGIGQFVEDIIIQIVKHIIEERKQEGNK